MRICRRWQATYDTVIKHHLNSLQRQIRKEIWEFINSSFNYFIAEAETNPENARSLCGKKKASIPTLTSGNAQHTSELLASSLEDHCFYLLYLQKTRMITLGCRISSQLTALLATTSNEPRRPKSARLLNLSKIAKHLATIVLETISPRCFKVPNFISSQSH